MIRFCTMGVAALVALATATFAEAPKRVVSLGGAVTEIVVALGAEDSLIARDSTSTYPPSVLKLPDVGYVRAISPEGIMALNPDLILAEGKAGPAEAVEVLKKTGIPYVALPDTHDASGIEDKIRLVGKTLGRDAEADKLVAEFDGRMKEAQAKASAVQTPVRVLFILGMQGGKVMAGGEGSSADAIIKLAGGENAASGFNGYKPMTDEAILTAKPDVILLMANAGGMGITDEVLRMNAALAQTPAVQSGAIVRMDGMKLLGFGPRTPEAILELNAALYPGQ